MKENDLRAGLTIPGSARDSRAAVGGPPTNPSSIAQSEVKNRRLTVIRACPFARRAAAQSAPAWIDLPGDVIMSDSNSVTNKVDATQDAAQRRFYRVRQLP